MVNRSSIRVGRSNRMSFLLTLLLFLPFAAGATENIALQLKWKHAFQFAGFYMAVEKGYYAEQGLNVRLIEGGPGRNPIDYVLEGSGRYGITDTGVLLARSKGKPVKALAAVFQHSPLVLAVLRGSGIRSFSDLAGKRVMMQSGLMDAAILAAIQKAGVGKDDFVRMDTSFNLQDLVNGTTDAFSVYLTDQPHQLQEMGVAYRLLRPSDYGIDFYGDILIGSDEETRRHPERTEAFIEASMKGWDYALNHIDETVGLIMARYNSQKLSREQLYYEAYKTSEMVLKDVVSLGYMSPPRWHKIADTYASLGLIGGDTLPDDLLFVPEPTLGDLIVRYHWQAVIVGMLVLLTILGLQLLLLRRMVRSRTSDLEQSESRFRTLVDNIPGVVFRSRLDGRCTMEYISDAIEDISGYPASDFTESGDRSYRSIVHPDDLQKLKCALAEAQNLHTPLSVEYRIVCTDGSERWILETGQLLQHDTLGVARIDGFLLDITDRKRAELLRESISTILEMVAGETNLDHILERLVAIYEQRYPGLMVSILIKEGNQLHLGAAPSMPAEYNALVDGIEIGPMVGSCGSAAWNKERVIAEDIDTDPHWAPYAALVRPFNLRACWSEPILDAAGEVLGTFAMYARQPRRPDRQEIDDIAQAARLTALAIERDRSFQRLRKLSRAIEQSSEVITIADCEGFIEYVNPAYTAVTGFSREEAIGQRLHLLHDQGQERTVRKLREAMQSGDPWRGKVSEQRKDGSIYPAMLTVSPIRSDDGEITHYIAVHEDMSQMQMLEQQFNQAQKMEAIGTLVGGIAHDFNNMLAGITGNLYLAREEAREQPQIVDKLMRIETLTMRASDMIRQLLTFASKDIVQKQPLELAPFLKETLKLHRVSIPESIELLLQLEDGMTVSADITQMQQLLLNLLTNARDAVAGVAQPEIHIGLSIIEADEGFILRHPGAGAQPYAHLCVRDNGQGIDKEVVSQIFEPFFTTKEIGKGTGLGLSMVFGTVKSHDGFIDVDTDPGRGSTFHIYLPLLESGGEPVETISPAIQTGNGETILLVDDEAEILNTTGRVLEALGYHAVTAQHGRDALDLFASDPQRFDLIISDVVMPKMGGLELARAVREIDPLIPIVFATGYDRKQTLGEVMNLRNSLVMDKPFAVERLAETVHRMLNE